MTNEKIIFNDRISIPVECYINYPDGTRIPCITTESDYTWQFFALLDRIFHPKKYENEPMNENLSEVIERLTCWLIEHSPKPLQAAVSDEIRGLCAYAFDLPECKKEAAYQSIKTDYKARYKRNRINADF